MIRYAMTLCALLACGVALYGIYALYEYRQSVKTTEDNLVSLTQKAEDETRSQSVHQSGVRQYVEIVSPSAFVNSDVFTLSEHVGSHVILVTFITYGCINCQNTFSFLRRMDEQYREKGLKIIGIHTPEFAYERDAGNVADAMKRAGITFPVVLDNEYATWKAYGNKYWPARYLIDRKGNIVFSHFGEGAYEDTEHMITTLLQ